MEELRKVGGPYALRLVKTVRRVATQMGGYLLGSLLDTSWSSTELEGNVLGRGE